jgi:predicted transposase YbfD/YdcC
MATKEHSALVDALAAVPDPRRQCKNLRHQLVDILGIGFCAVLSGCDDFVEIEQFAQAKEPFFRRFLNLPNGIPSHDTFRRVFQAVSPSALQACLIAWLKDLRGKPAESAPGAKRAVGMDGKTLRRTFDNARGLGALHVVSAWAADNGITLGQVATDEKSNEITALPQLIELLDLKDCVVTIDAAGCQKNIAAAIVAQEADYVLALKGNQETLHEQTAEYFEQQLGSDRPDAKLRHERQVETGHGRTETRDTFVAPLPKSFTGVAAWVGLATIVMVIRQSVDHATQKVTGDVRYFISSLPAKVKQIAGVVRGHWGIENRLHWVLDVAFNEDRMRLRDRNAIENLALLNRLAVSVLRQDTRVKAGVKCKRKTAGWNDDYLLHLLLDNS